MSAAISVENIVKRYGDFEAVAGITFQVEDGEIFGLLGPNGAGKTTTVGILTTLVRPTSGAAVVGGHDVLVNPLAVRRSIGVVFQDSVLDNDFTGAQNLWLHARLWRVPDPGRRIASLLAAVGLSERADDVIWTYSGGMRRRLEIARALLAGPSVLFLDEPTLGLDPVARRDLWQVVRALRARHGVTIVLSTHYLEEAQDMCDRVAIIDKGRIVEEGGPAELVERLGNEVVDLTLAGPDASRLLAALHGQAGHLIHASGSVSVVSPESRQVLTDRMNALALDELGVSAMTIRAATLNDVFLHLTATRDQPDLASAVGSRA
jgi:ABC-2 type transport system ATP-binding protein